MLGFGTDMLFRIPALLIALTIHEYSHARVAQALGDPTPKLMGRTTLNPLAHLDPFGLLMLWLFRLGWAKPVPVNPSYFRNGRQGMFMVSLAGPAANIVTAFVTAIILALLTKINAVPLILHQILIMTIGYNVVFAIFNLIPLPPLDGSKILMSLLPGPQAYAYSKIEPYGQWILIILVYIGVVELVTFPLEKAFLSVIYSVVKLII